MSIQIPKREILLPQELNNKLEGLLQQLVILQQESNGVLLYLPIPKSGYLECRVDQLYMTAVGTIGHVKAEQMRMDIINKFFEMHPEYRFIKWHTHSEGTGEYWHRRLSSGDIDSYREQLRRDPEFIGMMISPVKKIIVVAGKGDKNTTLRVVPTWLEFHEKSQYLHDEIMKAAKSLGYDSIPRLRATRKKS